MRKVLIANRGEIAVRVARACRDAGLTSVAVYAEPDRDAPHVLLADEAHALGGQTPTESYLDAGKLLAAADATGADAVHPGYGFLSENADFAQAVIDSGRVWIGPPPAAIRALGDKVRARAIARRVGAPLAVGTEKPVTGADQVIDFARDHGLPLAIKAVHGGGGRGLKVARTLGDIPDLYASAVREASVAFGRGECFVERYLERPRHVETQCLADAHGSVAVISTRDCTLQRRHQKLIEEAPAPFLTAEQDVELRRASKAILAEAGYVGAGTCEFLIAADGTIAFLEVNTRLQVEHPVTEEVTGIDLVREMFRLAAGEALGYDDPPVRGHAIEFRVNAEDPGRQFLPAPGTLTRFDPPSGPGVRLDAGVRSGTVIGPAWDSLLAKLIVVGATRREALHRARRALREFTIDGTATVLPFHRLIVEDPAFTAEPFAVHTSWVEQEFAGQLAPQEPATGAEAPQLPRHTVVVEVNGRRMEVSVPAGLAAPASPATPLPAARTRRPHRAAPAGTSLTNPMQGTVVKVAVSEGEHVEQGQLVAVIEAMKMEQPLTAHRAGIIKDLRIIAGDAIPADAVICEIKD
ncbi:acetyl/propionyl/methylcrotonyl-CoA carboxylase subunit alpha [Micromonospora sp. NBC_00617]|uniref:acetyl/propionyl/methylcrotonyl-CoA carboxylase subunit alpha n=1 Tax=Micromonospora sp. NBC_00617 TaxID=2903587 RepID=UPI003864ED2E